VEAEEPTEPRARIVIQTDGVQGTSFELSASETLIGRNPTADITLLDEGISREHVVILLDEESGVYTVEDLQSTNGTKVNGKRVRSAPLSSGDIVELGQTRLEFILEG